VAGLRAAAQDADDQASGLRVGLAEAREQLARLQRGREHSARHHRCHVRIKHVHQLYSCMSTLWMSVASGVGAVVLIHHALLCQCSTCLQPLVQDTRDAVVEAATAGALDRRLAALERRVSAVLMSSCFAALLDTGIVPDMFGILSVIDMLRHPRTQPLLQGAPLKDLVRLC
jgi:hypothetical protein